MEIEKINELLDLSAERSKTNLDEAIEMSTRALNASLALRSPDGHLGWKEGIARSYVCLASFVAFKGDHSTCFDYYSKALQIWEDLERNGGGSFYISPERVLRLKALTLMNTGNILYYQGELSKALEYYLAALKINEQCKYEQGVANILGNLATLYNRLEDPAKSLDYYFRTLALQQKLQNTEGMSLSFGGIAGVYFKQKDFVKALDYSRQSLKIDEETNNKRGMLESMATIASIYARQGEHEGSLEMASRGLRMAEEIGDKRLMSIHNLNIGMARFEMQEYARAERHLKQALKIGEEIHYLSGIKDNCEFLSSLYEHTGDFRKALEYYKKSMEAKDSLFNEEKTKEITRREMNYEFEKKEMATKAEQIQREALLNLQVSEIKMKALRSQMNPHFIFNALQSIQSFLLSRKPNEANTYLLKFAKLMRLVLENSQHAEVPLKEDIEALELYIQLESLRLKHPFTYQFHIDKALDMDSTTIPPLILQPFVENAIWHGLQYKAEPGHIDIYISKRDNVLYATVEDNGVGREKSKKASKDVGTGFGMKKESLGMKLTEERLNILNEPKGTKAGFKIIDLFSEENKVAGTKVELSLPV